MIMTIALIVLLLLILLLYSNNKLLGRGFGRRRAAHTQKCPGKIKRRNLDNTVVCSM